MVKYSDSCTAIEPDLQSTYFSIYAAKSLVREWRVRFTSHLTVETQIPRDYLDPLPPARPPLVRHSKFSLKVSNMREEHDYGCEQDETGHVGSPRDGIGCVGSHRNVTEHVRGQRSAKWDSTCRRPAQASADAKETSNNWITDISTLSLLRALSEASFYNLWN